MIKTINTIKRIQATILILCMVNMISCQQKSKLPAITPDVITEQTPNDTDDPAIWVNIKNPEKSIIFGTDKKTNGGVYAFDLEGKIIQEKSIKNISRPNNVDISYQFKTSDSTKTDILVFTEREKQQIRVFSIPDMKPIDNGGIKVFVDEKNDTYKAPMGVALYHNNQDEKSYAIVGRKSGPKNNYLHQYELVIKNGIVTGKLVRKFGTFSGKKEIEAIAVDNELGYIYYADEQHCIRKYFANPTHDNKEIACFGGENFQEDIEGIAIAKINNNDGYIIVSNQQKGEFNLFDRKTNEFIKSINLSTTETDGCEVTTVSLGQKFPNGLFVAMNDNKNFYFYDFERLIK